MSDPAAPRPSVLSEEMLRVIRGEVPPEEKREQYRDSLHRWAHRAVGLSSLCCCSQPGWSQG